MITLKKLPIITASFALILSLSISTAYAQSSSSQNSQSSEQYELTVEVVDAESGEALADAKIEILGIYTPHSTNQNGQYVFQEINTVPHTFKIYADGYQTWKKTVTVSDDSKLTVELMPEG